MEIMPAKILMTEDFQYNKGCLIKGWKLNCTIAISPEGEGYAFVGWKSGNEKWKIQIPETHYLILKCQ